ncbi:tRNA(Arg) A34 adenosine deaminase TadA [Monaibacterium marinum]|uniref:tRNA(Arg) A34 adenosine deaminase TadA n=1 Tax=Pontivivens marinum TaxID=1690039 RepID=A0A2C9CQA4_9RHOB|nr:nucleoside deaminase [Monaibacterium marinum]SOH93403.1 tRNA(Arg) A34 adenosine deaminase TadA [Monaibacterium marinum]
MTLAARLLDVIENDIIPLTKTGVARGDKVFGAAILRKSDLSLVIAGTNAETDNPLWHGEVHTLKQFYEMAGTPPTDGLIFLSTHEPCTMCMSAITWAGFDNYAYFFSHEDSRDGFGIPHDLQIMKELYDLEAGEYRRDNAFFKASAIADLIGDDPELIAQAARITAAYAELSDAYQAGKSGNEIPLN